MVNMPDVAHKTSIFNGLVGLIRHVKHRIRQLGTAAGCGVNALSSLQSRINSMYCSLLVDTVMACKFFPGPVSRIAGMPDTAPSGAVFFIPSAIFTPLPDYAVTH